VNQLAVDYQPKHERFRIVLAVPVATVTTDIIAGSSTTSFQLDLERAGLWFYDGEGSYANRLQERAVSTASGGAAGRTRPQPVDRDRPSDVEVDVEVLWAKHYTRLGYLRLVFASKWAIEFRRTTVRGRLGWDRRCRCARADQSSTSDAFGLPRPQLTVVRSKLLFDVHGLLLETCYDSFQTLARAISYLSDDKVKGVREPPRLRCHIYILTVALSRLASALWRGTRTPSQTSHPRRRRQCRRPPTEQRQRRPPRGPATRLWQRWCR